MSQRKDVMKYGGLLVIAAGAGIAANLAMKQRTRTKYNAGRWHTVTVNRTLKEISPKGMLPGPLAEMGDKIEVVFRAAPSGQGTEISARLIGVDEQNETARVLLRELRQALRSSRALLETGEVLEADRNGSSRTTLLNWPMNYITKHAREEGRL
jgi:ferredoxin-NADP reductase